MDDRHQLTPAALQSILQSGLIRLLQQRQHVQQCDLQLLDQAR
jgi:hypothetical protein